jgi:prolyl 4-hydroxylase
MIKKDGLEVENGIFVIDNAIENCKELLSLSEKMSDQWESSKIFVEQTNLGVNKEIRDADVLDISPGLNKDVEWFSLAKKIWEHANSYSEIYNVGFSSMENPQMLKYEVGSGHYSAHYDSSPEHPRVFSAVLYLNDVESGGETYFERFDVSVTPKEGRLVLFPANFIYVHSALPPKSNEKFCIVTWFTP